MNRVGELHASLTSKLILGMPLMWSPVYKAGLFSSVVSVILIESLLLISVGIATNQLPIHNVTEKISLFLYNIMG